MQSEMFEFLANKVADFSELILDLFGDFLGMGRVWERPVEPLGRPWECGTGFIGVITDGDHVVEMLTEEFFDVLGSVTGNIDADLLHDFNGNRIDFGWRGAGAFDFELVAAVMAEDPFGHLGAAGVARAENENACFHSFCKSLSRLTAVIPPKNWLNQ